LTDAIPLEGIKGRFDHFGYGRGRVFAAASGSNAVVVVSVGARTLEHTISGIPDPQGVVFVPETNKLFVASGSAGKVYVYDGASYSLITTVDFPGGADNLRYDSAAKRVYVGCGDDAKSGVQALVCRGINRRDGLQLERFRFPAQLVFLEKSGPNIYVNASDLKQIVVINRATKTIARWPLSGVESNFPMALDKADHRMFVSAHQPARLAVFDTATAMICISTAIESESTCRDRKDLCVSDDGSGP
jgi:DNA-binding beta-propeller fold protein YncE